MSHPLLSRAEIQALLGQARPGEGEGAGSVGLQETGTGVAAWHELVAMVWQGTAGAVASAARPVEARVVRETLLSGKAVLPALQTPGKSGQEAGPVLIELDADPPWLTSYLWLSPAAATKLEDLAGGEWEPAAGRPAELAGPALPAPLADIPSSFAALVADQMRQVLRDVLGEPVEIVPRGAHSLPETIPGVALPSANGWLAAEVEFTWGRQVERVLQLFSPGLPLVLYRLLAGEEQGSGEGKEIAATSTGTAASSTWRGEEGKPGGEIAPAAAGDSGMSQGERPATLPAGTGGWTGRRGVLKPRAADPRPSRETAPRSRPVEEALPGRGQRFPSSGIVSGGREDEAGGGPPIIVRPVEFGPLSSSTEESNRQADHTELLLQVPMNITVELGRTTLPMQEVLGLGKGAVLELDRMAGEPVDILVNGRLIAKGEVVVIEENYGVKISAILSPNERLREGGGG